MLAMEHNEPNLGRFRLELFENYSTKEIYLLISGSSYYFYLFQLVI